MSYLNKFFAHVKNCEMFTRQQEAELYTQFKNHGDMEAREKLILSQSRLVLRRALSFSFRDKSLLVEYFNVGMYAVMHVVDDLFDPNKGKLSSIAFQNIFDALRRFSHEQPVVKGMSLNNSERIKRETGKLADSNLVYPLVFSLDCEVKNDFDFIGNMTFIDTVVSECDTPEESFAKLECSNKLIRILADAMKSFSERERVILQGRLFSSGSKITLEVLGKRFGVTRERVRQIEKRVKKKIAEHLRMNYPDLCEDFGLLT